MAGMGSIPTVLTFFSNVEFCVVPYLVNAGFVSGLRGKCCWGLVASIAVTDKTFDEFVFDR